MKLGEKKSSYGLNIQKENLIRIYYENEENGNELPENMFVQINQIQQTTLEQLFKEFHDKFVQLKDGLSEHKIVQNTAKEVEQIFVQNKGIFALFSSFILCYFLL